MKLALALLIVVIVVIAVNGVLSKKSAPATG